MTIEIDEKTELEVTADLLSNVPDKYQKNVGYFTWDFLRAIGKVFVELWDKLSYLTAFYNIENLNYDDLVKFVFQRGGIIAHEETYASGVLTVLSGTAAVLKGSVFETESGLQFESLEAKTVNANDTIAVQCLISGSVGNVPAQTIIISNVSGITVENSEAMTGGYEKETKESIIDRYYKKIQKPISSGNKEHYKYWAKEITGVGSAKVKPLWNGNNTVKVIIVDSNNAPASANLINTVQDYIDPYELVGGVKVGWGCGNGQAPVGAYCTVDGPQVLNINVSVDVSLKTGAAIIQTKTNITNAVIDYLKTVVNKFFNDEEVVVSYAAISSAIYNAEGVNDFENLTVNGGTNNIAIADTTTYCECPVLNSIEINIV